MARVRPDLLGTAEAERLVRAGILRVELDVLTFDALILKQVGRSYTPQNVRQIAKWFRGHGVEVSMVLAVGLPGTHHFDALRDAKLASELSDLIRLHPVLVLEESGLRKMHLEGRYRPLDVSEAVTTCDAMMRLLESEGVEVIRVGQNPINDQIGRALAGPLHPALRELVESKRMLRRLHDVCEGLERGEIVRLRCAKEDEGRVRGPSNAHLREMRAEYGLKDVRVEPLFGQARGQIYAEVLDHDG
jgi:histone acetyltransferase (RNA polymerase elongator complex component)